MATSGTYGFAMSINECILNAFGRIGLRGPAVLAEMLITAQQEANLLQIDWQNLGVSLWTVDVIDVPLVQGTATYNVDPKVIMILDPVIRTGTTPNFTDRYIGPLSRTDYAAQANKAQPGFPTSFWFDRLISPTITLWPVPDGNGPYTLRYYYYRAIQDADMTNGIVPEVPARFLDAWIAGLAARLARPYAPMFEDKRTTDAAKAWALAAQQDTENVALMISPMISEAYYRM